MIVCAGDIETFSFATPIGVGLINSAINLTRIALMSPPDFLLFIGSAGSYGNKKIFEIIESKSAANVESSYLQNLSYTPLKNFISSASDVSCETVVNSTNYITKSKKISQLFLQKGLELENMEFFSVMAVAKEFNIPAGGVFVVTNYCYEDAHKEFLANHSRALDILKSYLIDKGVVR